MEFIKICFIYVCGSIIIDNFKNKFILSNNTNNMLTMGNYCVLTYVELINRNYKKKKEQT